MGITHFKVNELSQKKKYFFRARTNDWYIVPGPEK